MIISSTLSSDTYIAMILVGIVSECDLEAKQWKHNELPPVIDILCIHEADEANIDHIPTYTDTAAERELSLCDGPRDDIMFAYMFVSEHKNMCSHRFGIFRCAPSFERCGNLSKPISHTTAWRHDRTTVNGFFVSFHSSLSLALAHLSLSSFPSPRYRLPFSPAAHSSISVSLIKLTSIVTEIILFLLNPQQVRHQSTSSIWVRERCDARNLLNPDASVDWG